MATGGVGSRPTQEGLMEEAIIRTYFEELEKVDIQLLIRSLVKYDVFTAEELKEFRTKDKNEEAMQLMLLTLLDKSDGEAISDFIEAIGDIKANGSQVYQKLWEELNKPQSEEVLATFQRLQRKRGLQANQTTSSCRDPVEPVVDYSQIARQSNEWTDDPPSYSAVLQEMQQLSTKRQGLMFLEYELAGNSMKSWLVLYDPPSNSYSKFADLPLNSCFHPSLASIDGYLYRFNETSGGLMSPQHEISLKAFKMDLSTHQRTPLSNAPLQIIRLIKKCLPIGNEWLYAIDVLGKMAKYHIPTDTWSEAPKYWGNHAAVVGRSIFHVGIALKKKSKPNLVRKLNVDREDKGWVTMPARLKVRRIFPAMVSVGRRLLVFGGYDENVEHVLSIESYEVGVDTEWKVMDEPIPFRSILLGAAVIGDTVYLAEGDVDRDRKVKTMHSFNITTKKWDTLPKIPPEMSAEADLFVSVTLEH